MPPTRDKFDGRTAAVLAVADALSGKQFAGEALRQMRSAGALAGREAGLAMEIAQGAIRHALTIDHVLGQVARYQRHRTSATLRAILATAAYQIIWMSRIPIFAAVDQAVTLARRQVPGRASGMVNAVLRRLSGAVVERSATWERLNPNHIRVGWDRACTFRTAVLPPPKEGDAHTAHLAAATGEHPDRYRDLGARHGAASAETIAWASQAIPVTVLQRNPLRATPDAFANCLGADADDAAEFGPDAAFVPASAAIMDLPAFADGLVYVQDTTAHRAALAVHAQPGERILDLCAAPGGKSVTMAIAAHDRATIIACDPAADRLGRVDANVARLGLSSVRTRHLPDTDALSAMPPFNAVLVDAPCSNTGVIAKRPEARLGLTAQKLAALGTTQRDLLQRAVDCATPGGRVIYSTCSIEPAENDQLIAAFLNAHRDWCLDQEVTSLPSWGPHLTDWHDGGYFAILRHAPTT